MIRGKQIRVLDKRPLYGMTHQYESTGQTVILKCIVPQYFDLRDSLTVQSAMNGLLVKREATVISSAPKAVVEKNPHNAFMGNVELEGWCFGLEWPVT